MKTCENLWNVVKNDKNLQKLNKTLKNQQCDGRMDGWTDGQTDGRTDQQ